MKNTTKWLVLLLIGAFTFRIIILFWSLQFRENTDVLRYKDAARIVYLHGFAEAYKPTYLTFGTLPNNQPPGSLYILSAAYNLELLTAKIILKTTNTLPGNNLFVNGPLVDIFLRFPTILADLILGVLIYFIVKNNATEKAALWGASLFLFTPPVWYNSAFWGQMDALNNLMFFIAIYFMVQKKYFRAVLFIFLSLFIKFSLLPFTPIFFYLLYRASNLGKKKLLLLSIICIGIIYILFLPVSQGNIFWIIDYIKNNSLGEMKFITNFAFNFWWTIFYPRIILGSPSSLFSFSEVRLLNSPLETSNFLFIQLQTWAIVIFILFCVPVVKKIHDLKNKILTSQNLLIIFCLVSMLSFCFLPRMHERYLYPLFPLLAALVGLSGKYLKTFLLLSFLNFLNLYIVWHPMTLSFLPYQLIANNTFQLLISFSIVITIMLFYCKAVLFGFTNEKRK